MHLDRIKALTDGVIAIVLTILVLGFEVPDHPISEQGLLEFLAKMREPLLAYVVSFGIVATYWVQHAMIFSYLRGGTRGFIWLNILFLLPLTLLPFFTRLRAEFHTEYRVTMGYAAANVVSGLLLLALWRFAKWRHLTVPLPPQVDRSMRGRILLGIAINVMGALAAPIDPHISTAIFLLLPVIYFSHKVVDRPLAEVQAES